MYEQKLHQLQSQLVTSRMMERELSADLEALQQKYDKDRTAAALKVKALHDKYSFTSKELSEMVGGNSNSILSAVTDIFKDIVST